MPKNIKNAKENTRVTDKRKERIIAAAYQLFTRYEFSAVSMSSIADASGISRVTLYKYFPTIDEIALEIFKRRIMELFEKLPDEFNVSDPSLFYEIFDKFAESFPLYRDTFRFLAAFDNRYNDRNRPKDSVSAEYDSFMHAVMGGMPSIRSDDKKFFVVLGNLFISFAGKLANRGEILAGQQEMTTAEEFAIFREIVRNAIRAHFARLSDPDY